MKATLSDKERAKQRYLRKKKIKSRRAKGYSK